MANPYCSCKLTRRWTLPLVEKAHSLNLSAGWYTNNFQNSDCESGWSKTTELHALHMKVARLSFCSPPLSLQQVFQ